MKSRPSCASRVSTGRKETAITRRAKKLAGATSLTASTMTASWSTSVPDRWRSSSFLCVCSTTTIAASTSSPIAIAIPPRDMMFAVIPSMRKGMKDTSTAIGIVIKGTIALGTCQRKRSTMKTTVRTTSTSVQLTLSTARRMRTERS